MALRCVTAGACRSLRRCAPKRTLAARSTRVCLSTASRPGRHAPRVAARSTRGVARVTTSSQPQRVMVRHSLYRHHSSSSSADGLDQDFQATRKTVASEEEVFKRIEADVKSSKVFLYMKGVPEAPQCGFSNHVVRILDHIGVDFKSANVLADQDIREGIKKYSDWPTIPQLYVNGEFVGGCDIVTQMFESGELTELLEEAGALAKEE